MKPPVFELLRCPNCRGELEYWPHEDSDPARPWESHPAKGILQCVQCATLFPVSDGIPILCDHRRKNAPFEVEVFRDLLAGFSDNRKIQAISERIEALERVEFDPSGVWEWEDLQYWDRVYEEKYLRLLKGGYFPKPWPERILQRTRLFDILRSELPKNQGWILEVGCGETNYFRDILHEHPNTSYIGVDLSFSALRINREAMKRPNSLYIMCPAEAVPIAEGSVGVLIMMGILHHTPMKAATIRELHPLLQRKSLIVIDEVLERPRFLPSYLRSRIEESAHEESVSRQELNSVVSEIGWFEWYREFHTPFYNAMNNYFQPLLLRGLSCHEVIVALDRFIGQTVGRLVPRLGFGQVQAVVRCY